MEIVWSDFSETCPILQECFDSPDLASNDTETLDYIFEILWMEIGSFVRQKLKPKFWSCFNHENFLTKFQREGESSADVQLQFQFFKNFVNAVKSLDAYYECARSSLEKLDGARTISEHGKNIAKLNELLKASLLAELPKSFYNVVFSFYSVSFRVFFNVHKSTDEGQDNEEMEDCGIPCKGCNKEVDKCQCQTFLKTINDVNKKLLDLELLDRLAGQSMTFLVQLRINEHIKNTCHGIFDRSHLKTLLQWLNDVFICWLMQVFHTKPTNADDMHTDAIEPGKATDTIQSLKVKLTFYVYENYALSIIHQFFSIIIDFPDSIPAIDDLKICMEKINLRRQITQTLKTSLEARILHPNFAIQRVFKHLGEQFLFPSKVTLRGHVQHDVHLD